MNVVKVMGGLGVQLFQYAFGKALKLLGTEVGYDVTWFSSDDHPQEQYEYRLDKFNTSVAIQPFLNQPIFTQGKYPSLTRVDGTNFSGYWQRPNYYRDVLPILKKELFVKKEFHTEEFLSLRNEIVNTDSVFMHVRRGDLLQLYPHMIIPIGYYTKALSILKKQRHVDRVYVFSDDMYWCEKNFKGVTFVDMPDYLCFELMRLCKHGILSYSSFSYMAALLNENPDKVRIMANITKWYDKKNNKRRDMMYTNNQILRRGREGLILC
jgi:hypothetical protein